MSAEKEFFRVEYNNRLDNDGDECIVPTVWFRSQGFDLVRQYGQGEQSALEHAKWYVSMFEKAMESYAREYHAKEMERKLEEVEKLLDKESKKKKTDVVKTILNNGATFVIARLKEQNT